MTPRKPKLVSIIGNNAAGKTSLAQALGRQPGFTAYLESHDDRPYQSLFSQSPQAYALPNQIDYFLARAEQEHRIRAADGIGVQDGGLDQDFRLYTRLFHHKGFLDQREFELCGRLFRTLRETLPEPEDFIYLEASLNTLRERLQARQREIDIHTIVTPDDLPVLQQSLDEWVAESSPLILQAEEVDIVSAVFLRDLGDQIKSTKL